MSIEPIGKNPAQTLVADSPRTSFRQTPTVSIPGTPPTPQKQNTTSHTEDLIQAVKATNDFVSHLNDNIQFSVDDESGKAIVKVIDSATKEIIKQIPSEEMISMAKALDKLQGLLVHQKV